MAKIDEMVTAIGNKMPHPYTNQDVIDMINHVEQNIRANIVQEYAQQVINTVASTRTYAYSGYTFEEIEKVEVVGVEYTKMSLRYNKATSYYKDGSNIALNPIPSASVTGGLVITHRKTPALYTTADITAKTALLLPEQFTPLYEFYCFSMISKLNQEFAVAQNWVNDYNNMLVDFTKWYNVNKPKYGTHVNDRRWE
jgi:hypothetical protein